jgi:hypothetical protein
MGQRGKRHKRKQRALVGGKLIETPVRARKPATSAGPRAKRAEASSSIDETYDKARQIAGDVAAALQNAATEQDVRLQVIDRVLTEVLGWDHNQIATEVNNNRGFADYALRDLEGRYVCVLEAKKRGLLQLDTAASARWRQSSVGKSSSQLWME